MTILLAVTLAALQTAAPVGEKPWQGEIMERLSAPVIATFTTTKPAYDLEICVANALTSLGTPTVLRDGPDNIVILASLHGGNAFLASASIIKTATGSRIDLRLRGKGFDDRVTRRIDDCL